MKSFDHFSPSMQNYKVSMKVLLAIVIATHAVPILSGILMAVGARKGKKLLLIPW